MRECHQCGGELEAAFRFCPWCAAPQRSKLVEFFRAHPLIRGNGALRVSRYLGPTSEERHVRFSVWNPTGQAQAAVSLDDDEAERLGHFLLDTSLTKARRRPLVDRIRSGCERFRPTDSRAADSHPPTPPPAAGTGVRASRSG